MRIILSLNILIFLLLGTNLKNEKAEPNLIIDLNEGIGQIKIGKVTKSDVEKILGKGKVKKYTISFCSKGTGTFKKVVYKKLGIEMFYDYDYPKKLKKNDTLVGIEFLSFCKLKTEDGIGIGSTRADIEQIYGEPNHEKFVILMNGKTVYHSIDYDKTRFEFEKTFIDSKNKKNAKVKSILIGVY